METKYDKDIKKLEKESVLIAQSHSKMVCQTDILKLKKRICENEQTIAQLDVEMEKTKQEIKDLLESQ